MTLVVTMAGSFGDDRIAPAVAAMRAAKHTVRNFQENNAPLGLAIDRREWSVARFTAVHRDPAVRERFEVDRAAIETADAVVLFASPKHSGRASHWEAGFACGIGVPVIIFAAPGTATETAYLWARTFVADIPSLLKALNDIEAGAHVVRSAKAPANALQIIRGILQVFREGEPAGASGNQ